jgi:hypothetical protein
VFNWLVVGWVISGDRGMRMRRKWIQCVVAAIDGFLTRDERSCLRDGCPQLVHNPQCQSTLHRRSCGAPPLQLDPAVPSLTSFACRNV